uniref:Uncharacterized protein n=1 Tax=Alloyangia mangrovi TaxID=1779329 RepID=A0A2A3JSG6_9RHOB
MRALRRTTAGAMSCIAVVVTHRWHVALAEVIATSAERQGRVAAPSERGATPWAMVGAGTS